MKYTVIALSMPALVGDLWDQYLDMITYWEINGHEADDWAVVKEVSEDWNKAANLLDRAYYYELEECYCAPDGDMCLVCQVHADYVALKEDIE
jgi:hypothetical protein